jgi:penicillin-binding protein 1A
LVFGVWAAAAGCLLGGVAGWGTAQFLHLPQVDQLAEFRPDTSTRVFASDQSHVASFATEQRIELKPEQIPNHLKQAIVAIEDAGYYEHGGVEPRAVLRAAIASIRAGKLGSGGGASTLTQQLARNLFLTRERTISRKLREMLLAIDIEKRYTKDQIITMYANQVFLGHGAYGVEAASRLYFDVSASKLTLAQAALLAGMIQSPNRLNNPFINPDGALKRRDKVLRSMFEVGFIDEPSLSSATDMPLGAALHRERIDSGAYFLEMARRSIEEEYGTDELYTAGLQVHLTMDPQLQSFAETAVREGLVNLDMALGFRPPRNVVADGSAESADAYSDPSWYQLRLQPGMMALALVTEVERQKAKLRISNFPAELTIEGAKWTKKSSLKSLLKPADLVLVRLPEEIPEPIDTPLAVELLQEPDIESALIAMDNRSGAILALVGGFDFNRSEFNRAVQSTLQCGSAFKPFVFLSAFQKGYTLSDTLFDAPILLEDGAGELTYCPRNYYLKYYGISTLRRALELSFNASAVKLQQLAGGEEVVETAKRFGVTTELRPYASLALGSMGVRLIDLVRAYSGFANLGEIPEPYYISEIYDRDGRLEKRFYPHTERVMPANVTYLLTYALRGVVKRGTGMAAARLDARLAGKTGTTDKYTDAWFIGYSPRITVGVWVGRNLKVPIGPKMSGAHAALPIWTRFMEAYLDTLTDEERKEDFPVPPGIVFSPVDWYTGRRAIPDCPRTVLEAFLEGTEPADSCAPDLHQHHELPWPFQEPFYTPRPDEPMPTLEAIMVADQRMNPENEEED